MRESNPYQTVNLDQGVTAKLVGLLGTGRLALKCIKVERKQRKRIDGTGEYEADEEWRRREISSVFS